MVMEVDESGQHRATAAIDLFRRGAIDPTDRRDPSVFHKDVPGDQGPPRVLRDDQSAAKEEGSRRSVDGPFRRKVLRACDVTRLGTRTSQRRSRNASPKFRTDKWRLALQSPARSATCEQRVRSRPGSWNIRAPHEATGWAAGPGGPPSTGRHRS